MSLTEPKLDPWNKLIAIKHDIINEMHVSKNEIAELRRLNDWLRRELDLETRYQGLLAEAERLIYERHGFYDQQGGRRENVQTNQRDETSGKEEEHVSERIGGKERAREYRAAYIARERRRGQNLIKVRSAYYRNDAGAIVGITYSSQKKDKKDAWFLNLQDKQFQEAILLCEIGRDSAQAIHLRTPFFEKYGRSLSKDEKGQIKFNVTRLLGKFYLQIPDSVGPVDVTDSVDSEPLICPHGHNDMFTLVPKTDATLEKGGVNHALSRRSKFRIIWVDDEPKFLELSEKLIHEWIDGAELLTFQNGDEAWQELQRKSPDVLITDMLREKDSMDGWTMIPLLAKKGVKYPVIVISGCCWETTAEVDDEKAKAEAVRFHNLLESARKVIDITALRKPFDVGELRYLLNGKLKNSGMTPK